ncbi:uncharacterized protein LOC105772752 [Gossypium raimondii]|uniref:Uncharacterized protein n=1 Tax=Gossypium raimondii TaxID=29730 RepID=A0A0D2U420_GOSRA|nr:uncharacterized protein LOC105772752 [Gossypium raimondii]KJB63684.1 hypothetical protein B456_010G010700 [Gossypium raimondii]KJB63686.1 hypothetical protein B456_010G010700 [Gossypium raimondii]KJB63687.1 hypothetical protein B456_010G010700 [Gossypium raimondii]
MNQNSPTSFSISIHHSQQQATALAPLKKYSSSTSAIAGFFGKNGYKFWVLTAIILLAFWSMFTGSVSLKWSSGNLTSFSYDFDFSIREDLDVLELEEREKVVRKMWDVYTHSTSIRLPRFWLDAFEAAYENLSSDVNGVRDNAISEIAKLSMQSLNLVPPSVQSKISSSQGRKKTNKEAYKKKEKVISNGNLQS